ncbi:hypothetical protein B5X24_HaOG212997 [Helicoverpa armigera]|nr:hypothetical protein B5X24_HaOG212997 [Helicoverpa armigera]
MKLRNCRISYYGGIALQTKTAAKEFFNNILLPRGSKNVFLKRSSARLGTGRCQTDWANINLAVKCVAFTPENLTVTLGSSSSSCP